MDLTGIGKRFGMDDNWTDSVTDEVAESVRFYDEETKQATKKAMDLLLHKDRTYSELSSRLIDNGFSKEATEFAMNYVSVYGYIDDKHYADTYIAYHRESKSVNEIRRKLKEKGISDDILNEAFSYDDEDYEDKALDRLIKKRLKGREVSKLSYEEKQKQFRYLTGKGFPFDKIKKYFSDSF